VRRELTVSSTVDAPIGGTGTAGTATSNPPFLFVRTSRGAGSISMRPSDNLISTSPS
jgi:hypothetical protein